MIYGIIKKNRSKYSTQKASDIERALMITYL